MYPVVPDLYFFMGWTYGRRPPNPYRAPSGTMTRVPAGHRVPCCADREPFLYLCMRAFMSQWEGPVVVIDIGDVAAWMGANRRIDRTRTRFLRVMSATFECPIAHGGSVHLKFGIGTVTHLSGRRYRVRFSSEFVQECRRGTPYSLEVASDLRDRPGLLDMYLALTAFIHDVERYDEFTHEYPTCERIPLPTHIGGARRALIARLDALRSILPDAHATVAPTGTGILVDIGEPKRIAYIGGSPQSYRERQAVARTTRAMPPEERRRLGQASTS